MILDYLDGISVITREEGESESEKDMRQQMQSLEKEGG